MPKLRFWLSTFVMLNIYVYLSFILTAKNGYEVNSIHSHWLTVALVKIFFTYLYFRATRRTFFQFALAAVIGIAVRLGMEGLFYWSYSRVSSILNSTMVRKAAGKGL